MGFTDVTLRLLGGFEATCVIFVLTLLLALPTVSGLTLDFDTSQLMDEDLSKFGSEREATLAKWDEVTTGKELVSSK